MSEDKNTENQKDERREKSDRRQESDRRVQNIDTDPDWRVNGQRRSGKDRRNP